MEDLGVIRKTKRVAFLDSDSTETDGVTETDEYSSDSKRGGTLDRFVTFRLSVWS